LKKYNIIIHERGDNMLLLDITTFKPENSVELFKRWKQVQNASPKDLKVVNQWFDAGGGRVITLFEVETIKDYIVYNLPFINLCQVDIFPVIEANEFNQFVSKYMKNLSNVEDSQ
jgi:hypothetical protein